jgi:hypothetical protein
MTDKIEMADTPQPETKETPMISVWLVVLASMVFVALGGIYWHYREITMLRSEYRHTEALVRGDITTLNAYLAEREIATSSIISTTTYAR